MYACSEQIVGETESILQTINITIQDIVAPDVRELKARMTSLEATDGFPGRSGENAV